MSYFSASVIEAAASEREVELTTYGRRTGRAHRTTLWISSDGRRVFVRSGGGLGRDWPRNLLAQGYLPLGATDGQTVILVETPRSFRGGLSFIF